MNFLRRWLIRIILFPFLWPILIISRLKAWADEYEPIVEAPEPTVDKLQQEIKELKAQLNMPDWYGIPIPHLERKRLYNIIQAMERGYWLTTGNEVKINEKTREALKVEFERRAYSVKEIRRIE